MEITIKGEAKEIAALLLEIKARPGEASVTGLSGALKGEMIKCQSLAGRVQT